MQGEILSRVSLSGRQPPSPLYGKEWAVRILLEYILCSAKSCYCMFTLTDTNSQHILMNTMINAAVVILH